MTPEQQAEKLAAWLEGHPGAEPPEGLDPDVIEAVYALRPDLAPPPRVSVDDILGAVTTGPLAPGWTPEADAFQGEGGAVLPFPAAAPPVSPARRRTPWARWAFGGAAGTLVAMAAAALLVVRFVGGSAPEDAARVAAAPSTATARPAAEKAEEPAPEEEAEVADLGADDLDDPYRDRLRRGTGGVVAEQKERGGEGTLGVFGGATGAPPPPPVAVAARPEPAPAPVPVGAPPVVVAARPKPTPAPVPVGAPPVVATPAYDLRSDDAAVADLDEEAPAGPVEFAPAREPVATGAASGEVIALDAAGASRSAEVEDVTVIASTRRPTAGARLEREKPAADEVVNEATRPSSRRDARVSAEPAAAPAASEGLAAALDLDTLRARAVPVDLPQGELLSRAGTEANADARLLVSQGRYVEAGNALLPTVTLPAPQGSTNAAQAATWFLQGDDAGLARSAAEAGLANTSGNTPERAWLWVLYGDALRRAGDLAGATTAYNEAIGLNAGRAAPPPEAADRP